MDNDARQLIERHHANYEVAPYEVAFEEGPGTPAARTRRIQAGFDVDVYGFKTSGERGMPTTSPDYALGSALLQEMARTISSHSTGGCFIEVIKFGETEFLDPKDQFQPEGMLRIEIAHHRGLNQPAGPSEERALEEIEKRLQSLGIKRRSGKGRR